VDVGDGACTTIRRCACSDCRWSPVVIDCGVYRGRQANAWAALEKELGPELGSLDTIIITHFDADHWRGFLHLPGALEKIGRRLSALQMIYPRLPDEVPPFYMDVLALQATLLGAGFRELDLASELQGATDHLIRHPVSQGDQFSAGGLDFLVHWPPKSLASVTRKSIMAAVKDLEKMAVTLEEAGRPELRENLHRVREIFPSSHQVSKGFEGWDQVPGGYQKSDLSARVRNDMAVEQRRTEDRFGQKVLKDDDPHGSVGAALSIPPLYRDPLRKISRRLARANNDLSLILEEAGGLFISFGDAGQRVLRRVVPRLRHKYVAMLAPHHGTYRVPEQLPSGMICISQNGVDHVRRWRKHLSSHGLGRTCTCTNLEGTIRI